jgi:putative SOS response-associated peptidase YedK
MCYHTSAPSNAQLVKEFKNLQVNYKGDEIFHSNGFDRPFLPVTLNKDVDSIIPGRWKLLQYWIKSEDDLPKAGNTLNARADEVFEKKSYQKDILTHRGLLYVNGFFEPHDPNLDPVDDNDSAPKKKEKENYYIYYPDHKIFTLGVVYTMFRDYDTNDVYPTFSIITTDANPLLEKIHNEKKRMPLIIPADKRDAWLFAEGREEIEQLMIPFDGELGAHRSFRVTAARGIDTNRPDIQDAI